MTDHAAPGSPKDIANAIEILDALARAVYPEAPPECVGYADTMMRVARDLSKHHNSCPTASNALNTPTRGLPR